MDSVPGIFRAWLRRQYQRVDEEFDALVENRRAIIDLARAIQSHMKAIDRVLARVIPWISRQVAEFAEGRPMTDEDRLMAHSFSVHIQFFSTSPMPHAQDITRYLARIIGDIMVHGHFFQNEVGTLLQFLQRSAIASAMLMPVDDVDEYYRACLIEAQALDDCQYMIDALDGY